MLPCNLSAAGLLSWHALSCSLLAAAVQGASQLQDYDYSDALTASLQFYAAQRSGSLGANYPILWRGDSGLDDVPTGGYYLGTSEYPICHVNAHILCIRCWTRSMAAKMLCQWYSSNNPLAAQGRVLPDVNAILIRARAIVEGFRCPELQSDQGSRTARVNSCVVRDPNDQNKTISARSYAAVQTT